MFKFTKNKSSPLVGSCKHTHIDTHTLTHTQTHTNAHAHIHMQTPPTNGSSYDVLIIFDRFLYD